LRGARHHVITVHDLAFLHYPQFLTAESRRYYNGQIRRAVTQSDRILADSEATKTDIVNMLNVPPEKIAVHLHGVDGNFKPLPPEVLESYREKLDLPPRYILFVGTFEPRKNVRGLLDAYRQLVARLPDSPPLVLAGQRGWLFDETMAYLDSLKLGSRVVWRENVPQDAMPALYNLASLLVMPSFYEGFGFPALEAMACGTPPIVSSRSSLPEVVGEVGLQVNPDDPATIADALEFGLTHPEWVEITRQKGRVRAATFTWERTAALVLSVYRSL
jgi:glycosyltransferase involved in cell wall biosynthesis